ncbi:MAG: hypothetical protein RTU63_11280 [Candidatus Thorarchaeota archaeon]
MKEIRVSRRWDGIYIRGIEETYYGSKVLNALKIKRWKVDDETFSEIRRTINELGYDLEISDES